MAMEDEDFWKIITLASIAGLVLIGARPVRGEQGLQGYQAPENQDFPVSGSTDINGNPERSGQPLYDTNSTVAPGLGIVPNSGSYGISPSFNTTAPPTGQVSGEVGAMPSTGRYGPSGPPATVGTSNSVAGQNNGTGSSGIIGNTGTRGIEGSGY
jgi:hypothetical protein